MSEKPRAEGVVPSCGFCAFQRCAVACSLLCACVLCAPPSSGQEPPQSAAAPRTLEAPHVLHKVDAIYPESALGEESPHTVVLLVTVELTGAVGVVEVAESAGPDFDAAAIQAVQGWGFEPARSGGKAVASRIRVPFSFAPQAAIENPAALPSKNPAEQGAASTRAVASDTPTASSAKPATQNPNTKLLQAALSKSAQGAPLDVTVHGERQPRSENRSASDFAVHSDVLRAAPRKEGAEVLRAVPGMHIGQSEGPAVAHSYMLRGFDAEHGQDIEFHVAGVPINLPSHVHGQGYADLGFLIADIVHEVHATEGLSDPKQGDFAVAGSIDVDLGVDEEQRGIQLRSGYGSFGTYQALALWAPKDSPRETFGAVQLSSTDGFGQNRAGQSTSAIVQQRFGEGSTTYRTVVILHGARSNLAGVLRQDSVDSGQVCFYCAYPYATAQAQSALAQRALVGAFVDSRTELGANGELGVWLGHDKFHLLENLTGFEERSRTLTSVSGRGDLIEQLNRTDSLGFTARYRSRPFRPNSWAVGTVEVGSDGRLDRIQQAQNLLDGAVRNETWDRRVDATVDGVDLGFWGDLDWGFASRLRARLGVRADALSYDVDDRLGNFVPLARAQDTYIEGFRRTSQGVSIGPRTSVEYHPVDWLAVLGSFGQGYRSPQARSLEEGEEAPFAKVSSADLGVRFDWHEPLTLGFSGYFTQLSDDIAFDASEGRLERIGATRRFGAVVHALSHPSDWSVLSVSATVVDASLLEPPPPSAQEPQPPFEKGQKLPFVPPLVVRGDAAVRKKLLPSVPEGGLWGSIGTGFSFLSARPLPYGEYSKPIALWDGQVGLQWRAVELSLQAFNLMGSRYAAAEYVYPSTWDPDGVRSRTPARHFSAGAPRSWLLQLGVTL